jgi:uncharacterized membrane protein YuzA (DUF378 family)
MIVQEIEKVSSVLTIISAAQFNVASLLCSNLVDIILGRPAFKNTNKGWK